MRIRAHRQVEVLVELGELADLVRQRGEPFRRQPTRKSAEGDVLPTRERLTETDTRCKEVQTATHDDTAALRRKYSADHTTQGRLARAVATDDRENRAPLHVERDVAQRRDQAVRGRPLAQQEPSKVGREIGGVDSDPVRSRDVVDLDRGRR
jgi:hypothetical protein